MFIIYFLFWKLWDQYRISIALLLKWFTLLKYPVNYQDTAHGGHNCPIRSNSFIAFCNKTFHSLVNVRDSDFLWEGIQVLWSSLCLLRSPIPALWSVFAVCWMSSWLFWSFDYRFSVIFEDATTILNFQRNC